MGGVSTQEKPAPGLGQSRRGGDLAGARGPLFATGIRHLDAEYGLGEREPQLEVAARHPAVSGRVGGTVRRRSRRRYRRRPVPCGTPQPCAAGQGARWRTRRAPSGVALKRCVNTRTVTGPRGVERDGHAPNLAAVTALTRIDAAYARERTRTSGGRYSVTDRKQGWTVLVTAGRVAPRCQRWPRKVTVRWRVETG